MNIPNKAETNAILDAVGQFVLGDRVHETDVESRTRAIYVFSMALGFLARTGVIDADELIEIAERVQKSWLSSKESG